MPRMKKPAYSKKEKEKRQAEKVWGSGKQRKFRKSGGVTMKERFSWGKEIKGRKEGQIVSTPQGPQLRVHRSRKK